MHGDSTTLKANTNVNADCKGLKFRRDFGVKAVGHLRCVGIDITTMINDSLAVVG